MLYVFYHNLHAVSDPALGGFANAPDTAGRPPTDGPTAAHGAPGNAPIKNLPAIQETPVQFLDWEDSLEQG